MIKNSTLLINFILVYIISALLLIDIHLCSASDVAEGKEIAMFRFVQGRPRSRFTRSIPSKHVIEIHRPTTNQTILIQISRHSTLLSPDFEVKLNPDDQTNQDDDDGMTISTREDFQHCIYTGHTLSHPGGRVALSSCGFQHSDSDFPGFTGLITTEDGGHWIVEPGNVPESGSNNYPHVLIRPHKTAKRCSSGNLYRSIDPSEEDLDAEEEFANYFATKEEDDHEESDTDNEMGEEENGEDEDSFMEVNNMIQIEDESSGEDLSDQPDSLVHLNANPNIVHKKGKGGKKKPKKKVNRVLELAVFADYKLYEKMQKKFPKNTLTNVKNYLLAQVNNMNLLYKLKSIGEGNEIEIRLNLLEIHTKPVAKLKTGKGKDTVYLENFCNWAAAKNSKKSWDHAMMCTGEDLRDESSNGVLGVAWTASLCENKYSCSLIEDFDLLGAFTMAHELGHCLGMDHDGEESNKKCDPAKFIMAALSGKGQSTWSTCSARNLFDYLARKSKIKGASSPSCLKSTSKWKKAIAYRGKKLPGQIFPAEMQCFFYSSSSKPVIKGYPPYDNICVELYCGNDWSSVPTHPALEGTKCGEGKWCRGGNCIQNSKTS